MFGKCNRVRETKHDPSLTCVNCGPAWDKDTARSPQTGGPPAKISRDLGVIRKLSNLHGVTF